MSGDGIGFSEISDVHRNERRSKVLTKLPSKFYEKAEKYLAKKKSEYDAESHNPSNPKAMMLQDEIKKLDKRMSQIYEMRECKIALASLSGIKPDNMIGKDKVLFDELSEVLAHYRTGKEPEPSMRETMTEPVTKPELEVFEKEPEIAEDEEEAPDSAIVQVLEDIPPFVDVDHTYVLKKNDVVTLPAQFADLLSSKGKVKIVEF